MRGRILLPTVLALTFGWLLIAPFTVLAASGLPSTIAMRPDTAGPGAQVEVVGLDFGAAEDVDIQLTTMAGVVHLATARTEDGGYFRQAVTLPTDLPSGYWELRATGAGGHVAVHLFESGPAQVATVAAQPVAEVTSTASGSTSGTNLMVVLILLAVIGTVAGAAILVYHKIHHVPTEPGMASGADPIWGGSRGDS